MQGARLEQIERLRAEIASYEHRPILAEGTALLAARDRAGTLATAPGLLHEVFTDERRNAGAALGFALGQAQSLITPERSAVIYLQLIADTQELGLPYGAGLASFGFDPQTLILCRIETITELLWAMEEAVACRAVAAVIADVAGHHKALDFTASRRLGMRAANAGASVFLVRYGHGREASAAKLRWKLTPAISGETVYDARAPGQPRWLVELEKGYLGRKGAEESRFLLDWTNHGLELVADERGAGGVAPLAPPYGAPPAALGHRLSQTA